jgi:hypothetical protein
MTSFSGNGHLKRNAVERQRRWGWLFGQQKVKQTIGAGRVAPLTAHSTMMMPRGSFNGRVVAALVFIAVFFI